ncbi:MAG: GntR family transcriptional regulator [Acidimicrobiales bacterium]|nr:GntR family transcriptional regulator [Acidimicrobiales bacterium]
MAIDRRTAGEQAAEQIRLMVWQGDLRAGDRLNQEDLAERLGVSRIPVREALLQLEHEGLIDMTPHRGAFVHALRAEDVLDHYELYGLIYGFALRRTTERADPEVLARVVAIGAEVRKAKDPDEVEQLMGRFLGTAAKFGDSPRLRSVQRGLAGLIHGNFFAEVPGSIPAAHRGVKAIVAAMESGDGDGASDACVAMMRDQGERALGVLRQRGLVVDDA